MGVYEDEFASGASLKWLFEELQFLAPVCWLYFSFLEVVCVMKQIGPLRGEEL